MIIDRLLEKKLIHPPKWLANNTAYLTVMGSDAYGVSSGSSDIDIYGFCLPPKEQVFPHLSGEIQGFGRQIQRFEQWSEHHIEDAEARKEYDFAVFSIVKYFQLCMENNPNMIDSLYTPRRCVVHSTAISEMVREHRRIFLHKGSFHKFRGYAFAQMSKIRNKTNSSNPKRAADIEAIGYDTKFAYHVVRLAEEAQQILVEGDLDLERNREMLKAIRRGEWTLEQLEHWFEEKERHLEGLYASSALPHSPPEDEIKTLLLNCLEHHYGSLDAVVKRDTSVERLLRDLQDVIARHGG